MSREKRKKIKKVRKEVEREFVAFYNAGGGEMHEVLLDFRESLYLSWWLQDLMKKRGKVLECSKQVAFKMQIQSDPRWIEEEEGEHK